MHPFPFKVVNVIPPQAIVDDASWTTAAIDTVGYDYAIFLVALGATDIAMAALKVQECDTSGGSYTDVTGAVFGTSENSDGDTSALPTATDDNDVFGIMIDLKGRKRFLDLVATAGDGAAGTFASALCLLGKGEVTPTLAADLGFNQILMAA